MIKDVVSSFLNDISIKKKLMISYVLVVFIPIIFVGNILTISMKNMVVENIVKEVEFDVKKASQKVTEVFDMVVNISNKLYADPKLHQLLLSDYENEWDIFSALNNYNDFEDYSFLYSKFIKKIALYVTNNKIMDTNYVFKVTQEINKQLWFNIAMQDKGKIRWQYIYSDIGFNKHENSLALTRAIMNGSKLVGVLVIYVDNNSLISLLQQGTNAIFLTNMNDFTIKSAENSSQLDIEDFNYIVRNENSDNSIIEDRKNIIYKGKKYKIIKEKISFHFKAEQFYLYCLIPLSDIYTQANKRSAAAYYVIVLSLIFSMGTILYFSGAISSRVRRISFDMHKVSEGNFNYVPAIKGKDEIGQLSEDLKTMIQSINKLIHEVYIANIQKKQLIIEQKEIKLKMLASQMNPHFLFNVLETIRMKLICGGDRGSAKVIEYLGCFLRKTLETENRLISVKDEIEMTISYLEIQNFITGNKINYKVCLEDDVSLYKILPMIIQPLAENSVMHGLQPKGWRGNIEIAVRVEDSLLKIVVEDDGVGISEDKMKQIYDCIDVNKNVNKKFGLMNVMQRIRLFYGEKYGINISTKEGMGTKIEVILPKEGNDVKCIDNR